MVADNKQVAGFLDEAKANPVDTCTVTVNGEQVFDYEAETGVMQKHRKINSITKSILSILIGIAIDKGYFADENEGITSILNANHSYRFNQRSLRDLLTMTSGIEWAGNEKMVASRNWVSYILNQDVREDQGFSYVCGNSHLLSAVLQEKTSMTTFEFATQHLFSLLEIDDVRWNQDPQGVNTGGFGIQMKPEDLWKYGSLYLNNGFWEGKRIVSEEWVQESVKGKVSTDMGNQRYGYHWWVNPKSNRLPYFYYAAGSGGQYIFVVLEKEMVCTFTGNFSRKEGIQPFTFFTRYLLHAFD
ncbi:serine hydrolase domain-containing protein [Alteribacter aurantiacus]|uniref:serine hydrolase domain-containing protein n=1 Tax=Alteribacter aurantiacus TaxID=254410 RepID=UPI0003FCDCA3|nr:serine hydrolase [Alteribacter aurantiacus]